MEDGTILSVGISSTDIGSVWSTCTGIKTYHTLGVSTIPP